VLRLLKKTLTENRKKYGDEFKIVVSIDDNLKQYIEIDKRGNKLYLGLKSNVSYSNTDFEVHITMPIITNLEASGASEIKITGFNQNKT